MAHWLSIFTSICMTLHLYDSTSYASQNLVVAPFMADKGNEDERRTLKERSTTTEGPFQKNCVCSKIYDPVCGSNNQSYYNMCQLECENKPGTVFVQHQGNCIPF